jgi:K+-sensing histidine kinase KdpD
MGSMTVTSGLLPRAVRTRAAGQRTLLTLAVAGVLFVAVLCLRLIAGDATDAYSMLYVFPVALVATTFGMRAGAAAGVLAVLLIAVWATADDISLSPLGWAARVLPILLLGVLVGEATDRLRRMESDRRQLEAAALLHREAIEINDSLVQGMAAAKWSLEAGSIDAGLRVLDDTIARAHDLVSDLIRRADMGGRTEALAERAEPPPTRPATRPAT